MQHPKTFEVQERAILRVTTLKVLAWDMYVKVFSV